MRTINLFKSVNTDPFYNLALEQYLFEKKKTGEVYVYLWQNDNTVVVGRYQNVLEEVNLEYVKKKGIKIVRRITGGGAVYHDLGNLNYSFITDSDSDVLDYCINIIGDMLNKLGIKFRFEGRNDILVNGYKISGTAKHEENGKVLYHGTLLISSDLQNLKSSLTRNTKIKDGKARKSERRKVANISDFTDELICVEDVQNCIISALKEKCTSLKYSFIVENIIDTRRVIALQNEKYGSQEWIYGGPSAFNYTLGKRFAGGYLSVSVLIEKNRVMDVKFSGDFFSEGNLNEYEQKLIGKKLGDEFKSAIISNYKANYFYDVSLDNILTLFYELICNV